MRLQVSKFQFFAAIALTAGVLLIINGAVKLTIYATEFGVLILNSEPTVAFVQLSVDGSAETISETIIVLAAGEEIEYFVVGEARDKNSVYDINNIEVDVYRSGVAGGADCVSDPQNCFHLSLDSGDCKLEPVSVVGGIFVCSLNFPYWADATVGHKATYEDEVWKIDATVLDADGAESEHRVVNIEVESILAVDSPGAFLLGTLEAGVSSKVGSSLEFVNIGNVEADFLIRVTDLECQIGSIPAENHRLDVVNGSYKEMEGSETSIILENGTGSYTGLVLPPRSTVEESVGAVYLTTDVPVGIKGPCSGESVVTGI
ncbi:MAG: hypothetical protein ABIA47_04680 [bacterium]